MYWAQGIKGEHWEQVRVQVCRTLGREVAAEQELAHLGHLLDEAYRQTVAHLPTNTAVQIEQREGEPALSLERLERQEEPESVRTLREQIRGCLPLVELPEVILEVEHHTGFAPKHSASSDQYQSDCQQLG